MNIKSHKIPALGVEPSTKMREICVDQGLDVLEGSFENIFELKLPKISGIWCAASLQEPKPLSARLKYLQHRKHNSPSIQELQRIRHTG